MEARPKSRVDELYEALWALLPTAATLAAIASQPALLDRTRTNHQEEGSPEQLAVLARNEIVAACRALDDRTLVVEPRWHPEGAVRTMV